MRVFITRKIPEAGLSLLRDAGITFTEHTEKRGLSREELISRCLEHDALLNCGGNQLDAEFLNACHHLKVIALMSVGYEKVDISTATTLGIPVSNTPDVLSRATSDIAFLLMLAVSRKAIYMHQTIRNGEWNFFDPMANLGIELYGKTLGIFGLGKIGLELARKCAGAFDMKVIYHNRRPNKIADELLGARYVPFEQLLQDSDVLSLHANLTEENRGLFNAEVFRKMKSTAIFINTSRGALHQEDDLLAALQAGTIWGAGLDVTNPEPMRRDHPLLSLPTVCVLPHIGSATIEARTAMARLAAENILAAAGGKPLPNLVNPDVYKK